MRTATRWSIEKTDKELDVLLEQLKIDDLDNYDVQPKMVLKIYRDMTTDSNWSSVVGKLKTAAIDYEMSNDDKILTINDESFNEFNDNEINRIFALPKLVLEEDYGFKLSPKQVEPVLPFHEDEAIMEQFERALDMNVDLSGINNPEFNDARLGFLPFLGLGNFQNSW